MKSKYIILVVIILGIILLFFLKMRANHTNQNVAVVANINTVSKKTIIPAPIRVGAVTWHTKNFVNKEVKIVGFVLKKEKGYILFSDEATGPVTVGDMPVVGSGVDNMVLKGKYILQGVFLYNGLTASNGNQYHLELTQLPIETK